MDKKLKALIRQLLDMDPKARERALPEFVRATFKTFFRRLYRALADEHKCEDILLQVYVDIWRHPFHLQKVDEGEHNLLTTVYLPNAESTQWLDAERQAAHDALRELRHARENALAVFAVAERKGTAGAETLAAALAEFDRREAQSRVEAVTAAREDERRKATERIVEAAREQERALAEAEAERVRNETARQIERQRAEQSRKHAENAKLVLNERAADPRVKDKYKPFLENGRFRPYRDRMDRPGPMYYTDLKALGVCDDHKIFARAGAGCWRHPDMPDKCVEDGNDRPRWPTPQHEDDYDKYRELFTEFCELAPIWATNGTLNP